jgi:hypothetical protein
MEWHASISYRRDEYEWYQMHFTNLEEAKERIHGIHIQILFTIFAGVISVDNIWKSIKLLMKNYRAFATWCRVIIYVFSFNYELFHMLFIFPHKISFRSAIWQAIVRYAISLEHANLLLLHKAYCVVRSNRWLLVIAAMFTMLISFMFYAICLKVILQSHCTSGV